MKFLRRNINFWSIALTSVPIVLLSPGISAQTQVDCADNPSATGCSNRLEEIVITGSRLVRPTTFDAPAPVTVVSSEDIIQAGAVNLGDMLNELPSLGSTFSLSNSSRFIGLTGFSGLNLRNLGTERTLTLVNGRRHVGALPGSTAVDVNAIPTDLVDRVEVVTGGTSAVYGADAVAGVVNFVLKDRFEGFSFTTQTSTADDSGFDQSFVRLTGGANFGENRGNAVLSLEYTTQDDLQAVEREETSRRYRLVRNPANTGPGDGIPDEIFVPNAGLFIINSAGVALSEGSTFDPDGTFRPLNLGTNFGGSECGDCDFLDLDEVSELRPELDRYSIFGKVNYDISENVTFFTEANYVNVKSRSLGQPAFNFFGDEITIFSDNAFAHPTLQQYFTDNSLTSIDVFRFNVDAGRRSEDSTRETIRIVSGLKGEIANDWGFEASALYNRNLQTQENGNNRINDRFLAATDAVLDPMTNEIVCRISIDPNATLPNGNPVSDFVRQGCVPTSIFGNGAVNSASRAYFNTTSITTNEIEQSVFNAYVYGEAFQLPAGKIGLVFGLEHRKEESKSKPDPIDALGITFFNALQAEQGAFDVNEFFTEVSIPVLRGLFLVEDLTIDLAARYSDYSTIDTTTNWKVGVNWTIFEDLRLRSTLSEAIRAPNISELFGPQNQNFFAYDDPCSIDEINNAANVALRMANCAALGIPATFDSVADAATVEGISGGNPDLDEETADSYTIGLIYQPSFLEGLSISVDYFDIEVKDAIAGTGAQSILERCVDAPSINNNFCSLITRDPSNFEVTNIVSIQQNLAATEVQGYDIEIGYRTELFGGNLSTRLVTTILDELRDFPFQNDFESEEVQEGELGNPELAANLSVRYQLGNFVVRWESRFLDRQLRVDNEVYDANPEVQSPVFAGSTTYHDVFFSYDSEAGNWGNYSAFIGIDNVGNKRLPIGLTGAGAGSGIYDNIGRKYYVGLNYNF